MPRLHRINQAHDLASADAYAQLCASYPSASNAELRRLAAGLGLLVVGAAVVAFGLTVGVSLDSPAVQQATAESSADGGAP